MNDPTPIGTDERSTAERVAWRLVGPPLYYCEHCLRAVDVVDGDVMRRCTHDQARVIAPRRSILAGAGGLTTANKIRMAYMQAAAKLTGRSV